MKRPLRPFGLVALACILLTACQSGEVGTLREENVRLNAELANARSELQASRLEAGNLQEESSAALEAELQASEEKRLELEEELGKARSELRAAEEQVAQLQELSPEFIAAPEPVVVRPHVSPEATPAESSPANAEPNETDALLAQARSGALHSAMLYRHMEDPMYSFSALAREYADCSNVGQVGSYPTSVGQGLPCRVEYVDDYEIRVIVEGGGVSYTNGIESSAL